MHLADARCGPKLLALALAGALALASCGSSSSSSSQQESPLTCAIPHPTASAASQPTQVFALGTNKVGTTLSVSVPAGAASITIIEQIVSAPANAVFTDLGTLPNDAIPLSVTDPNGNVVFDTFKIPPDPTQAKLYFASSSPGAGTLTLPNTAAGLDLVAAGLPQGSWSLVVSDLAHACSRASNCASGGGSTASTYDVTVIVKPGAGAGAIPAAGKVDVTFNLTSGNITPPLTAATAGTDADLLRLRRSLETLLAPSGLTLGTVSYVDVPSAAAAKVASGVNVDDGTACGEMAQLLATAPPGRQVNIFLVSAFVSNDTVRGTSIAGFDGTIPGPATISPTLQSGAAVSAADLRSQCGSAFDPASCGADLIAYATAHEMGHYFGLYHVTERDGTSFDPLTDTPTCSCQTCASNPRQCADASPAPATPHTMGVAECVSSTARSTSCGGGDNLMFWLFADGALGNLTSQQAAVMRANPAVY